MKKVEKLKSILKKFFKGRTEVEFAYLFGSTASGKRTEISDIDIAVFLNEKEIRNERYRYGYKAELTSDLMSLINTNKVDIVILNNAPLLLKNRIVIKGNLIFTRNRKKSLNYKLRITEEFLDYQVTGVH